MSRVDGGVQARELSEHSISKELHDPATLVAHNLLGDPLKRLDQLKGEVLIVRRQSRKPGHIRKKDGSESTLNRFDPV